MFLWNQLTTLRSRLIFFWSCSRPAHSQAGGGGEGRRMHERRGSSQRHTVDECLGGRGAAGDIDVHGHDAIAATHHGVGVVVVAAAVGAAAHRQDVARLRHLVVDLAEGRGHLVGQRACASEGGFGMRARGAGAGRLAELSGAAGKPSDAAVYRSTHMPRGGA